MSKSSKGTKKTSNFINTESTKYVDRSSAGNCKICDCFTVNIYNLKGQHKVGSTQSDTQAAHKLSFGLVNTIETNTSGRPLNPETKANLARDMNNPGNLRVKTSYGNQVLDERRDARIANAYVNETPIEGKSTAARAFQAYKGASTLENPKYAEEIGNVRVHNPETGGYYMVKNYKKYN